VKFFFNFYKKKVESQNAVRFTCLLGGYMKWYHNDKELTNKYGRILDIDRVTANHEGYYECRSRNTYLQTVRARASLSLICRLNA